MTTPTPADDSEASREIDRRFSEIVADYGPTPTVSDEGDLPALPPGPHQVPAPWRGPQERVNPAAGDQQSTEEDEHFVPAPPDPLPAGDLHFWAIVAGLTVGPLLVFLSAALAVVDGMPFGALGVLMTVIGFVLLVLRSPRRRSGDEGSGARV